MHAPTHTELRERFAQMRREGQARHRDIAATLGISEGELIAAHVGARQGEEPGASPLVARRLQPSWPQIVEALEPVGEVMALTRNASCVHEKTGVYRAASHAGAVGLVLGGAIDLRLFYSRWMHGFAVDELTPAGVQRSLQFFDAAGLALHKIFVKPQSDVDAWFALVERFLDVLQHTGLDPAPTPPASTERSDDSIDVAGLRDAWATLRDTHEFFGLLKRFGVGRQQALRLAETRFVQRVEASSAHQILNAAAGTGVPIMVFVGNPGVIQIHGGPVHKVAVMGPWLNVLDPAFNLHLREDHIASAWVVRKPTVDGLVTSLELFDAAGETIAMLFGERKPGQVESCGWRTLVGELLDDYTGHAMGDLKAVPCAA